MTKSKFYIAEAFKFGWHTVIKNLGLFIPAAIIILFVKIIYALTSQHMQKGMIFLVFFIIFLIVSVALQLGIIKICLGESRERKMRLADLFSCLTTRKLLHGIVGSIIYQLIVIAGCLIALAFANILHLPFLTILAGILLIFPGIYFAIKYKFFIYFILDKSNNAGESLKASAIITRNHMWKLFLFYILIFIINIIGVLVIGVGLLVTLPLSMLAEAHVYRKLSE